MFASSNQGKITEVQHALRDTDWQIYPQSEYNIRSVAETGLTFVENAILKARHAAQISGCPALADDSGIVVDILGGAPGIYSARYAGDHATAEANNSKLLTALADIKSMSQRKAYFVCVIVLLKSATDPTPQICFGDWHGQIALEPRGIHGHGYDPVFYLPDLGCTAAEITLAQKNQCSHRAAALKKLREVD